MSDQSDASFVWRKASASVSNGNCVEAAPILGILAVPHRYAAPGHRCDLDAVAIRGARAGFTPDEASAALVGHHGSFHSRTPP